MNPPSHTYIHIHIYIRLIYKLLYTRNSVSSWRLLYCQLIAFAFYGFTCFVCTDFRRQRHLIWRIYLRTLHFHLLVYLKFGAHAQLLSALLFRLQLCELFVREITWIFLKKSDFWFPGVPFHLTNSLINIRIRMSTRAERST